MIGVFQSRCDAIVALKLPLSRDRRGVARVPEHVREGPLTWDQRPEVRIVSNVALARHNGHPAGGAQRRRVAVSELDARVGQLVEPRSLVLLAAVGAEALVTNVIGHDQHDIEGLG